MVSCVAVHRKFIMLSLKCQIHSGLYVYLVELDTSYFIASDERGYLTAFSGGHYYAVFAYPFVFVIALYVFILLFFLIKKVTKKSRLHEKCSPSFAKPKCGRVIFEQSSQLPGLTMALQQSVKYFS